MWPQLRHSHTLTEDFLKTYYPLDDDYCSLYEVDDFAWYHGGRKLYDAREMKAGTDYAYDLSSTNLARTTAKVGIDQLGDGVTDGFSSESGSDQPSGGGTNPDGDERP